MKLIFCMQINITDLHWFNYIWLVLCKELIRSEKKNYFIWLVKMKLKQTIKKCITKKYWLWSFLFHSDVFLTFSSWIMNRKYESCITNSCIVSQGIKRGNITMKVRFPRTSFPKPKYLQELFSQMASKDQWRKWEQIRRTIDFFFKSHIWC